MSRYVVTELEGFLNPAPSSKQPGLSCMVIDTVWNYRVLRTFRTEDYGQDNRFSNERRRQLIRQQARAYAEQLERVHESAAA
jgi:hypothetical protein